MYSAFPQNCDSLPQSCSSTRRVFSSEIAEISCRILYFKTSTALGLVVYNFLLRCGRRNNHVRINQVTARATEDFSHHSHQYPCRSGSRPTVVIKTVWGSAPWLS